MDPTPPSSKLGRFVAELRRRHVVRVAIAYAAAGFVLLQAAEIVLPAFLPGFEADAALRVVVVVFLLLFPVVVALAWVYEITPQGIRSMEALDAEAGRQASGRVLPRLALLGFIVVAAGSAGWWWYRTDAEALAQAEAAAEARRAGRAGTPFVQATTTDADGPIRSLAVLPLDDYGADPADDWFAAGMHEAIISQLSQLGTVRVISRTSSEGYQREGKSMPQVGQELGVDAVVEGSVFRADGAVRITVQLIHAASDTHLLARDYERELADVLSLQREVASAIASEIEMRLQGRLAAADRTALAETGEAVPVGVDEASDTGAPDGTTAVPVPPAAPVAPEVQEAVMRGRFALRDGVDTDASEAERYFRSALERDSTFVPALTGLAGTHLLRGLDVTGPAALQQLVDARTFAVRAVQRDSTSVEAREVLASTEEALAEYGVRMTDLAAEVGNQVRIVRMGGDSVMLVTAGDTVRFARDEAPTASATEMGRMIQVALANDDEGGGTASDEFRAIVRLEVGGRYDAALARARAALDRFPDSPVIWDAAERLAVTNGDLESALEVRQARAARTGLSSPGPGVDVLAGRVDDEGVAGYWSWKLDELEAREAGGGVVSPVERAAAHSALGQVDEALAFLEQARGQRDPRLVSLRTDPVWDPLRPDERFKALLRSLGPRGRTPDRAPRGGVR